MIIFFKKKKTNQKTSNNNNKTQQQKKPTQAKWTQIYDLQYFLFKSLGNMHWISAGEGKVVFS